MAPFYTNNFDAAPVGLYAPGAMFQGWSVLSNWWMCWTTTPARA